MRKNIAEFGLLSVDIPTQVVEITETTVTVDIHFGEDVHRYRFYQGDQRLWQKFGPQGNELDSVMRRVTLGVSSWRDTRPGNINQADHTVYVTEIKFGPIEAESAYFLSSMPEESSCKVS